MNGRRKSWTWLTGGRVKSDGIAEEMTRLFADPAGLWRRIQETIKNVGETDDAESAIEEINLWLAKDPNPWLEATINCKLAKLPVPWKEKRKEFSETAARITEVVLRPIPKALRHYQNAKRGAAEADGRRSAAVTTTDALGALGRTESDLQLRDSGEAFSDRDYTWRFFGDPEVHNRKTVKFPVAAVFNKDTDAASGRVVSMTIEVLSPGTGTVVPHPLLALGGLEVEDRFKLAANGALVAASYSTDTSNQPVTIGFFSEHFLDHKIGRFTGVSAGGAFALAFARVLAGKPYDQRVIVISAVDEKGNLSAVENNRTGKDQTGLPFLDLKAVGIVEHNKKLLPNDPTRIDTVAVVASQEKLMNEALDRAGANQSDLRVKAIEELDEHDALDRGKIAGAFK